MRRLLQKNTKWLPLFPISSAYIRATAFSQVVLFFRYAFPAKIIVSDYVRIETNLIQNGGQATINGKLFKIWFL